MGPISPPPVLSAIQAAKAEPQRIYHKHLTWYKKRAGQSEVDFGEMNATYPRNNHAARAIFEQYFGEKCLIQ